MRSGGAERLLASLRLAGAGSERCALRSRLIAEVGPPGSHGAPTSPRKRIGERCRITPSCQPPHHFVELLEVAVADLDGAAGIAMIDADREPERVADALLQRDRVGILRLAAARLLRLALRHAFDMRQRLGLADVEAFLDDALGGGERIGHADQRAGMAGRQLARARYRPAPRPAAWSAASCWRHGCGSCRRSWRSLPGCV